MSPTPLRGRPELPDRGVTEASPRPLGPSDALIRDSRIRWFILVLLCVGALGVRAYGIGDPPLDFHPERQFRSAHIARAISYEASTAVPEWKRAVAEANLALEGMLEPPVIEHLAVLAYRVAGQESLWMPKLLSALFWVVGGVFLYRVATRVASPDAALISVSAYLFVPYSVVASTSFQPDPLMVMLLILSLDRMLRLFDTASWPNLLIAAAAATASILVKPVALFFIAGGFLALGLFHLGFRGLLVGSKPLAFVLLGLVPGVGFYLARLTGGEMHEQAGWSIIPALIVDPFYWAFWLKQIHNVIGFTGLIAALLGMSLLAGGWRRGFVVGLWGSYLIYGLVFTHHIHTHDYYHLPLVPIAALSLGPLGAHLLRHALSVQRTSLWRGVVWSLPMLAVLLAAGLHVRSRQDLPNYEPKLTLAREIGEVVEHSTRTVVLGDGNGYLRYYGEFAGWYWPVGGEREQMRRYGVGSAVAKDLYEKLVRAPAAEYFIVTNLAELEAQDDLRNLLLEQFQVISRTEARTIFRHLPPNAGVEGE